MNRVRQTTEAAIILVPDVSVNFSRKKEYIQFIHITTYGLAHKEEDKMKNNPGNYGTLYMIFSSLQVKVFEIYDYKKKSDQRGVVLRSGNFARFQQKHLAAR